jgi:CubicO group peptidase (beta-lactamase class C family)
VLVAPDWVCELEGNDRRSAKDQMGAGNPNRIFGRGIQLRWSVCRKEDGKTFRYAGAGDRIRSDWHEGHLVHGEGMVCRAFGGPPRAERTSWNGADLLRTTIGDYAKFVVSVMHDQGLTKEIAAERATMTRDLLKPEDLDKVCKIAGEVGHCTITVGMGLGWEVKTLNGVKILEHDGSDWGVRTFAMFVPSQGIGVIVFTNGENGTEVIRKVVKALYPNQLYLATM